MTIVMKAHGHIHVVTTTNDNPCDAYWEARKLLKANDEDITLWCELAKPMVDITQLTKKW